MEEHGNRRVFDYLSGENPDIFAWDLPNAQAKLESFKARCVEIELISLLDEQAAKNEFGKLVEQSTELSGTVIGARSPEFLYADRNGKFVANETYRVALKGTYLGIMKVNASYEAVTEDISDLDLIKYDGRIVHVVSVNFEENDIDHPSDFNETTALYPVDLTELRVFDDFLSFDPRVLESGNKQLRSLITDLAHIALREDVIVSDKLRYLGDRLRQEPGMGSTDSEKEFERKSISSLFNMASMLSSETLLLPDYYVQYTDRRRLIPGYGTGLELTDVHFTTGDEYPYKRGFEKTGEPIKRGNCSVVITGRDSGQAEVYVPLNQMILVA